MVEVCTDCGSQRIEGTCDKCGANCCRRHLKETGKGDFCPECFDDR